LQRHTDIEMASVSRRHETRPVGGPIGQPAFLNAAAVLHTSLPPQALWAEFQRVETDLGRDRTQRWGARTIDLDLLLYDNLTLVSPELVIPHPRMAWRRFVLQPATEVAAEMVHPGAGRTVAQLLEHLDRTPWYAAIAGPIGAGKSRLAGEIAEKTGARLLVEQVDPACLDAFYHNPSGLAWQTELEFLEQRAGQLAIGRAEWAGHDRPTVSDFWFEQSPAFAGVWLPPEQWQPYLVRYEELHSQIVRPRLIVLLHAPREALLPHIRARGRPGEQLLTIGQLARIERALDDRAAAAEGPLLRLDALDQATAVVELAAAVEAMR
jgi:2-amino-4-hydroxy-6-hydroxymethyldihydropteridine diphosphokinase